MQLRIPSPRLPEEGSLPNTVIDTHTDQKKISRISTLLSQINIGFARDFAWGAATYRNVDFFAGRVGAFGGPTLSQMATTILPTIVAANFNLSVHKRIMYETDRSAWLKQQVTLAIASWSSIPVWNGAQLLGAWVGDKIPLSATEAGYFSGVFTGVAESIWQGAMVIPLLQRQRPNALEVVLNMLSGAVWQWILQANLTTDGTIEHQEIGSNDNNEILVGVEIASGVAFATLFMTLVAWTLLMSCRRQPSDAPIQPGLPTERTPLLSSHTNGSPRLFSLPVQIDSPERTHSPVMNIRF